MKRSCRSTAREVTSPQQVANWLTGEFFRLLYADGKGQDLRQIATVRVQPRQLAALLTLVDEKTITANSAKKALEMMFESGEDAATIIAREGLAMVNDDTVIDEGNSSYICRHMKLNCPRYRSGEEKLFGFFMGQVMRATKGKADPDAARRRLLEMLKG